MAQRRNPSPPPPRIPFSRFLSLFSYLTVPPLSVLHLPPLCLTLSCLSASICLQSFPLSPPPLRLLLPPRFPLFPSVSSPSYSFISPSLTRAVTGAVINHESRALSGTTEPRGAPFPLPLSRSPFYLSRSPCFNKFVPVNKPSKMTPSS